MKLFKNLTALKQMVAITITLAFPSSCKTDEPDMNATIKIDSVRLYPIPCKDFLTLEIFPKEHEYTLILNDYSHNVIWKTKTPSGFFRVNVDTLRNGVYILSIISKEDTVRQRVVVNK